jgi:hypothetical protein
MFFQNEETACPVLSRALNGGKIAMKRQDCPCSFAPTIQSTFVTLPLFQPKTGQHFEMFKKNFVSQT